MQECQIDSVFKLQCLSLHQQNKDEKSNDYQNKCKNDKNLIPIYIKMTKHLKSLEN